MAFFSLSLQQLDESKDFEERKMIRAAMRDLRKRKRGNSKRQIISNICFSVNTDFVKGRCTASLNSSLSHQCSSLSFLIHILKLVKW